MDIAARSLKALEWSKLTAYLCAQTSTEESYALAESLAPTDVLLLAQTLLEETEEALALLKSGSDLSQAGLTNIRNALAVSQAGGCLSAMQLNQIRKCLELARRLYHSLKLLEREHFPQLTTFLPKLHVLDFLEQAINIVVDKDGRIRDDASQTLRNLKAEINHLNNRIHQELSRLIQNQTVAKALQEPLYTTRNGRYCLPLQASMRHALDGIVHDSSASGLTIYVEPLPVLDLTNKIKVLEGEIEREIERLLLSLSEQVKQSIAAITSSYSTLVEIDFIWARAKLAWQYHGTKPKFSADTNSNFILKELRHPLLLLQGGQKSDVIPNDIGYGAGVRTLLITGPNTGGKTVLLKAFGLASIMSRTGLLLPCQQGSSLPFFSQVFADIGDDQSLEQSLSTFSSHMTSIIEIVKQANNKSLILLDEIGVGTDPHEGAALAHAILLHLHDSGACSLITTHYGDLKEVAHSTPGFANASMEFDEINLVPTYKVRWGVSGKSKAIEIAKRLGLPLTIIEAAVKYARQAESDLDKKIAELEIRLADTYAEKTRLEQFAGELEQKSQAVEQKNEEAEKELEKLRLSYNAEMATLLKEAGKQISLLVAELQRTPGLAKAQKTKEALAQIEKDLHWQPAKQKLSSAPQTLNQQILPGSFVKSKSLNQTGTVEKIISEAGEQKPARAEVKAGNMRLVLPLEDLVLLEYSPAKQLKTQAKNKGPAKQLAHQAGKSSSRASSTSFDFVRTSFNTLDIRGQRADEAISHIESFVDSCASAQISPFMIIHGHGTGALKSIVRSFLASTNYNVQSRPGDLVEGGDGVTIGIFR